MTTVEIFTRGGHINSLLPDDAIYDIDLGLITPDGTKPLPEQLITYHQ